MKIGPMLIAGAAAVVWTASGCGVANSLMGREKSTSQWLQHNQAKIFEEELPEPEVQPFTHFAAGQLFEEKKQIQQAIIQYRKALDLNPKFVGAHNRLAICLDKLGQHAQAERALREAIKLNPDLAYLRNNLAFSLMAQKRWGDSEPELRSALRLKPDYQRARINLGIVMSKLARRGEAFQQFQIVLGDARAHYNIGLLDKAGGRYAQAAESFRNAIELEPTLKAARRQLATLRRIAAAEPHKLGQQRGNVAPSPSIAATTVPPRQSPPAQPSRAALDKQPDQAAEIAPMKSAETARPSTPPQQHDAVVAAPLAAQALPRLSEMPIEQPEDPICEGAADISEPDFSWELADVSANTPSTASHARTAPTKLELPAAKAATARATDVVATRPPVRSEISYPVRTAPVKQHAEPAYHEIEVSTLPFLVYEEPCDVRESGSLAAQPQLESSTCEEDELVDQFVLGESGFDMTPDLPTSLPQPTLPASVDGQIATAHDESVAWTAADWRRFAREHHLATDPSELPSVLMRLRGDLPKQWQPPRRTTGGLATAPTMPNPAAEIERSVSQAP